MPNADSLSPEEKLKTLRELDIFHHWDSIDERRLCRRCGQIIAGREIKVTGSRHNPRGVGLECPTEGCPSVPFEWLMLEAAAEVASQPPLETCRPEIAPGEIPSNRASPSAYRRTFFRFGFPIA